MENLRQLQQRFQNYILQKSPEIAAEIVESPPIDVSTRLHIYGNGYVSRLIEVLSLDFSGLRHLLGQASFEQLCRDYLQAHPSVYRSVRWLPVHLQAFLQRTAPYCENSMLAEMVAFEWSMQQASDSANISPVTIAQVVSAPAEKWPDLRFQLHPAVQRLDLWWNVAPIWYAVEEGGELPPVELSESVQSWVIWRTPDWRLLFSALPLEEARALDVIAAGQNFATMCEQLCEFMDEPSAGPHAAQLLQNWLIQGMITGVSF